MGCGCKKGKGKVMNNLNNVNYITEAKQVYNETILGRDIDSFTDLEKVIILQTYNLLYPASSIQPSLEEAINKIKEGIEVYDIRRKK